MAELLTKADDAASRQDAAVNDSLQQLLAVPQQPAAHCLKHCLEALLLELAMYVSALLLQPVRAL